MTEIEKLEAGLEYCYQKSRCISIIIILYPARSNSKSNTHTYS